MKTSFITNWKNSLLHPLMVHQQIQPSVILLDQDCTFSGHALHHPLSCFSLHAYIIYSCHHLAQPLPLFDVAAWHALQLQCQRPVIHCKFYTLYRDWQHDKQYYMKMHSSVTCMFVAFIVLGCMYSLF